MTRSFAACLSAWHSHTFLQELPFIIISRALVVTYKFTLHYTTQSKTSLCIFSFSPEDDKDNITITDEGTKLNIGTFEQDEIIYVCKVDSNIGDDIVQEFELIAGCEYGFSGTVLKLVLCCFIKSFKSRAHILNSYLTLIIDPRFVQQITVLLDISAPC